MLPPRSNQGAGGTLECVPSGIGQELAEVVGEGGGGGGGGVVVALVAVRHDGVDGGAVRGGAAKEVAGGLLHLLPQP